jgi:hypothetical protein
MSGSTNSGRAVLTAVFAGACLGLAGAALSVGVLNEDFLTPQTAHAAAVEMQTASAVNREAKSDALPVPANPQERAEIKSVEVVGLRGASIVYRDRSGNILFQTDPLANVTVVTKNVELPEVTIRETETTKVERLPVDKTDRSARPHGCESAFARPAPESLTRTASRCVTELNGKSRVLAALN